MFVLLQVDDFSELPAYYIPCSTQAHMYTPFDRCSMSVPTATLLCRSNNTLRPVTMHPRAFATSSSLFDSYNTFPMSITDAKLPVTCPSMSSMPLIEEPEQHEKIDESIYPHDNTVTEIVNKCVFSVLDQSDMESPSVRPEMHPILDLTEAKDDETSIVSDIKNPDGLKMEDRIVTDTQDTAVLQTKVVKPETECKDVLQAKHEAKDHVFTSATDASESAVSECTNSDMNETTDWSLLKAKASSTPEKELDKEIQGIDNDGSHSSNVGFCKNNYATQDTKDCGASDVQKETSSVMETARNEGLDNVGMARTDCGTPTVNDQSLLDAGKEHYHGLKEELNKIPKSFIIEDCCTCLKVIIQQLMDIEAPFKSSSDYLEQVTDSKMAEHEDYKIPDIRKIQQWPEVSCHHMEAMNSYSSWAETSHCAKPKTEERRNSDKSTETNKVTTKSDENCEPGSSELMKEKAEDYTLPKYEDQRDVSEEANEVMTGQNCESKSGDWTELAARDRSASDAREEIDHTPFKIIIQQLRDIIAYIKQSKNDLEKAAVAENKDCGTLDIGKEISRRMEVIDHINLEFIKLKEKLPDCIMCESKNQSASHVSTASGNVTTDESYSSASDEFVTDKSADCTVPKHKDQSATDVSNEVMTDHSCVSKSSGDWTRIANECGIHDAVGQFKSDIEQEIDRLIDQVMMKSRDSYSATKMESRDSYSGTKMESRDSYSATKSATKEQRESDVSEEPQKSVKVECESNRDLIFAERGSKRRKICYGLSSPETTNHKPVSSEMTGSEPTSSGSSSPEPANQELTSIDSLTSKLACYEELSSESTSPDPLNDSSICELLKRKLNHEQMNMESAGSEQVSQESSSMDSTSSEFTSQDSMTSESQGCYSTCSTCNSLSSESTSSEQIRQHASYPSLYSRMRKWKQVSRELMNRELMTRKPMDCELVNSESMSCELVNSESVNHELMNSESMNQKLMNSESMNHELMNSESMNHKLMNSESMNQKLMNSESMNHELMNSESMNHELMNSELMNRELMNSESMNQKLMNSESMNHELMNSESMNYKLMNSESINQKLMNSESQSHKAINSDHKTVTIKTISETFEQCVSDVQKEFRHMDEVLDSIDQCAHDVQQGIKEFINDDSFKSTITESRKVPECKIPGTEEQNALAVSKEVKRMAKILDSIIHESTGLLKDEGCSLPECHIDTAVDNMINEIFESLKTDTSKTTDSKTQQRRDVPTDIDKVTERMANQILESLNVDTCETTDQSVQDKTGMNQIVTDVANGVLENLNIDASQTVNFRAQETSKSIDQMANQIMQSVYSDMSKTFECKAPEHKDKDEELRQLMEDLVSVLEESQNTEVSRTTDSEVQEIRDQCKGIDKMAENMAKEILKSVNIGVGNTTDQRAPEHKYAHRETDNLQETKSHSDVRREVHQLIKNMVNCVFECVNEGLQEDERVDFLKYVDQMAMKMGDHIVRFVYDDSHEVVNVDFWKGIEEMVENMAYRIVEGVMQDTAGSPQSKDSNLPQNELDASDSESATEEEVEDLVEAMFNEVFGCLVGDLNDAIESLPVPVGYYNLEDMRKDFDELAKYIMEDRFEAIVQQLSKSKPKTKDCGTEEVKELAVAMLHEMVTDALEDWINDCFESVKAVGSKIIRPSDVIKPQMHRMSDDQKTQDHSTSDVQNVQGHGMSDVEAQGHGVADVSKAEDHSMPDVHKAQDHSASSVPEDIDDIAQDMIDHILNAAISNLAKNHDKEATNCSSVEDPNVPYGCEAYYNMMLDTLIGMFKSTVDDSSADHGLRETDTHEMVDRQEDEDHSLVHLLDCILDLLAGGLPSSTNNISDIPVEFFQKGRCIVDDIFKAMLQKICETTDCGTPEAKEVVSKLRHDMDGVFEDMLNAVKESKGAKTTETKDSVASDVDQEVGETGDSSFETITDDSHEDIEKGDTEDLVTPKNPQDEQNFIRPSPCYLDSVPVSSFVCCRKCSMITTQDCYDHHRCSGIHNIKISPASGRVLGSKVKKVTEQSPKAAEKKVKSWSQLVRATESSIKSEEEEDVSRMYPCPLCVQIFPCFESFTNHMMDKRNTALKELLQPKLQLEELEDAREAMGNNIEAPKKDSSATVTSSEMSDHFDTVHQGKGRPLLEQSNTEVKGYERIGTSIEQEDERELIGGSSIEKLSEQGASASVCFCEICGFVLPPSEYVSHIQMHWRNTLPEEQTTTQVEDQIDGSNVKSPESSVETPVIPCLGFGCPAVFCSQSELASHTKLEHGRKIPQERDSSFGRVYTGIEDQEEITSKAIGIDVKMSPATDADSDMFVHPLGFCPAVFKTQSVLFDHLQNGAPSHQQTDLLGACCAALKEDIMSGYTGVHGTDKSTKPEETSKLQGPCKTQDSSSALQGHSYAVQNRLPTDKYETLPASNSEFNGSKSEKETHALYELEEGLIQQLQRLLHEQSLPPYNEELCIKKDGVEVAIPQMSGLLVKPSPLCDSEKVELPFHEHISLPVELLPEDYHESEIQPDFHEQIDPEVKEQEENETGVEMCEEIGHKTKTPGFITTSHNNRMSPKFLSFISKDDWGKSGWTYWKENEREVEHQEETGAEMEDQEDIETQKEDEEKGNQEEEETDTQAEDQEEIVTHHENGGEISAQVEDQKRIETKVEEKEEISDVKDLEENKTQDEEEIQSQEEVLEVGTQLEDQKKTGTRVEDHKVYKSIIYISHTQDEQEIVIHENGGKISAQVEDQKRIETKVEEKEEISYDVKDLEENKTQGEEEIQSQEEVLEVGTQLEDQKKTGTRVEDHKVYKSIIYISHTQDEQEIVIKEDQEGTEEIEKTIDLGEESDTCEEDVPKYCTCCGEVFKNCRELWNHIYWKLIEEEKEGKLHLQEQVQEENKIQRKDSRYCTCCSGTFKTHRDMVNHIFWEVFGDEQNEEKSPREPDAEVTDREETKTEARGDEEQTTTENTGGMGEGCACGGETFKTFRELCTKYEEKRKKKASHGQPNVQESQEKHAHGGEMFKTFRELCMKYEEKRKEASLRQRNVQEDKQKRKRQIQDQKEKEVTVQVKDLKEITAEKEDGIFCGCCDQTFKTLEEVYSHTSRIYEGDKEKENDVQIDQSEEDTQADHEEVEKGVKDQKELEEINTQVEMDSKQDDEIQVENQKEVKAQIEDEENENHLEMDSKANNQKDDAIQMEDQKEDEIQMEDQKEDDIQMEDQKDDELKVHDEKDDKVQVDDQSEDKVYLEDHKEEIQMEDQKDEIKVEDQKDEIQVEVKEDEIQMEDQKVGEAQMEYQKGEIQVENQKEDEMQVENQIDEIHVEDQKEDEIQMDNHKEDKVQVEVQKEDEIQMEDQKDEIQVEDETQVKNQKENGIQVENHIEDEIQLEDQNNNVIQVGDQKEDEMQTDNHKEDKVQVEVQKEDEIQMEDQKDEIQVEGETQVKNQKENGIHMENQIEDEIQLEDQKGDEIQVEDQNEDKTSVEDQMEDQIEDEIRVEDQKEDDMQVEDRKKNEIQVGEVDQDGRKMNMGEKESKNMVQKILSQGQEITPPKGNKLTQVKGILKLPDVASELNTTPWRRLKDNCQKCVQCGANFETPRRSLAHLDEHIKEACEKMGIEKESLAAGTEGIDNSALKAKIKIPAAKENITMVSSSQQGKDTGGSNITMAQIRKRLDLEIGEACVKTEDRSSEFEWHMVGYSGKTGHRPCKPSYRLARAVDILEKGCKGISRSECTSDMIVDEDSFLRVASSRQPGWPEMCPHCSDKHLMEEFECDKWDFVRHTRECVSKHTKLLKEDFYPLNVEGVTVLTKRKLYM